MGHGHGPTHRTLRPALHALLGTSQKYGAFFKISQSPKIPHVNVDNLRDLLFQVSVSCDKTAGDLSMCFSSSLLTSQPIS